MERNKWRYEIQTYSGKPVLCTGGNGMNTSGTGGMNTSAEHIK